MIVWGGVDASNERSNTGGRYDPAGDAWTESTANVDVPDGRLSPTAVWTGLEMLVWGGSNSDGYENTGGRYYPAGDRWTPTSHGTGVPLARIDHTAVWTGTEMIVWGGWGSDGILDYNTGGRYQAWSDTWTPTSTGTDVPHARSFHTAVWTGTEMIIWGGNYVDGGYHYPAAGGIYDPVTDLWSAIEDGTGVPTPRVNHTAVWTGSEMIVWGGHDDSQAKLNSGGRYDPATGARRSPIPFGRVDRSGDDRLGRRRR